MLFANQGFLMKVKRRDYFLKMVAGAGVAIALGGGFWNHSKLPLLENFNPLALKSGFPRSVDNAWAGAGLLSG